MNSPSTNKTVELYEAILVTIDMRGRERYVDLRSSIMSLTIYENLFRSVMTGEMTIQDNATLSSTIPLTGMELIRLRFGVWNPDTNKMNVYGTEATPLLFVAYAQEDRSRPRVGMETYTLRLMTKDLYTSSGMKTNFWYTDKPVEDMVRDIMTNVVKSSTPFVSVEQTQLPASVSLPTMSPIDATQWLCRWFGQNAQKTSNYVFFETLEGYHFRSIRHLIEAGHRQPMVTITQELAGLKEEKNSTFRAYADEITIPSSYDLLHLLSEGYFASTTYMIDVMGGKFSESVSTTNDVNFKARPLIGGTNALPIWPYELGAAAHPQAKMFVTSTTTYAANHADSRAHVKDSVWNHTIADRYREMLALQLRTVRVTMPGMPSIHVGSLVNIRYPLFGQTNMDVTKDIASGVYCVIACKHELVNTGKGSFSYQITFEAGTDSKERAL